MRDGGAEEELAFAQSAAGEEGRAVGEGGEGGGFARDGLATRDVEVGEREAEAFVGLRERAFLLFPLGDLERFVGGRGLRVGPAEAEEFPRVRAAGREE